MLDNLANKIVDYMLANQYKLFTDSQYFNIVYVEGMSTDGKLNNDEPNQFNDIRTVIAFEEATSKIVGIWEATTEPGSRYTYRPMNPKGAARIAFGQYTAWRVGIHGNSQPHEALLQVAPVTVFRDLNKDFIRPGDKTETDLFGINQHWGYDLPKRDIGLASAGCLVGRTRDGHREFMALVKSDRRYQANNQFIFTTTIIPGDKLSVN